MLVQVLGALQAAHKPGWPQLEGLSLPKRAEAIPVALGRRPNAAADLAAALDYFWSDGGRAATGITLNLDGGEWMVP